MKEESGLEKAVKRAERGDFREYWLQLYVKNNYKRLGFNALDGPFEIGYDFRGKYKGRKVVVEVESSSKNFVYHKHSPKDVDILIVLNDDNSGRIKWMEPAEWKKRLPRKIIKVDAKDFVKSTYEMRRAYAIMKQKEEKRRIRSMKKTFPLFMIKGALSNLWSLLGEEVPYEGTPEAESFDEALNSTAMRYIKLYDLNFKKFKKNQFTKIELLANDMMKSRREFDKLTRKEKAYIENWLGVLSTEYGSRV